MWERSEAPDSYKLAWLNGRREYHRGIIRSLFLHFSYNSPTLAMLALLIFALWAVSARAVAIVKREDVSCEMVFSGPLALLSLDRPTVWNVSNEQAAENFNALVVQSPGLSQLQVEFQKCDSTFSWDSNRLRMDRLRHHSATF